MKKVSKFITMFCIMMTIITVAANVLAVDPSTITIDTSNSEGISNLGGKIIGMIQVVGSVLAVGMLVVIGVKYMLGSAEEKAEYKKSLMPYLIGAILIFSASQLAGIIFNFTNNLEV